MIITFTTDFGAGSYVAQMKGVVLSLAPAATLVDVTHDVPAQQVRAGAMVLASVAPRFPTGSIQVAVVDPGVGTARRIVAARVDGRLYVAPDNGLLSRVIADGQLEQLVELTEPRFWLPEVSRTFHGRDIMAPAAAYLALGTAIDELGPRVAVESLVPLDWPQPVVSASEIVGQILSIDSFGNLLSNIPRSLLPPDIEPDRLRIACAGAEIAGLATTYGERPSGELVALVGSDGLVELALVDGRAAARLSAAVDAPFVIRW